MGMVLKGQLSHFGSLRVATKSLKSSELPYWFLKLIKINFLALA